MIQGQGKRFTTTSVLRLKPGSDDDYREYTCQAKHKSLQAHMPMSATVQLSVLCKLFFPSPAALSAIQCRAVRTVLDVQLHNPRH